MHPAANNGGLKSSIFKGSFELNKESLISLLKKHTECAGPYVLCKTTKRLIFADNASENAETILGHDDLIDSWFEDTGSHDFNLDNYSCGSLGISRKGKKAAIRIHFAAGIKHLECPKDDFEVFKAHFMEMLQSFKLDPTISFETESYEDRAPLFLFINIKLPF